jgi:hypothetical protein
VSTTSTTSTSQRPFVERRRSPRISPKGSVVLFAGELEEHGRLGNISSSGLLAITENLSAIPLGSEVGIELRLDIASSEWLQLSGRVVRIDGCALALVLATDTEPFLRLMDGNLSASGVHQRVRSVVLIDATPERRELIAEAFRASGCAVLEIATPLEAIVRLGELQFEPDLVAIADSLPSSISDELRGFVEREHPEAKLVTVGDGLLAPSGSARWMSSSSSQGDLLARIRELLGH